MCTFLTMFGASALATILFAPKNTQDYSSQFNSLNEGINKLDGKLDWFNRPGHQIEWLTVHK